MIPPPPSDGADVRTARPASRAQTYSRAHSNTTDKRPGSARQPILVPLQDVEREPLSPLWDGYLYRGKLHLVEGDPGLGKSTLALDIAARVSRGAEMPDGAPGIAPAGVVILSAEDGLADTIRPRLEAAGADLSRIVAQIGVSDRPGDMPALPTDRDALETAIRQVSGALAIVDPLVAYLDPHVNSWRDQDVRRALGPLMALAQSTGCAILCIRHLNKSASTHAVYRGGGSIGLGGAARVTLLVAADPDNEQQRVLATVKNNLSPEAPSLAFRLVPEEAAGVARVKWLGESEHRPSSLLAVPQMPEDRSAIDEAVDVLRQILADGPLPATTVQREARDAGISAATLKRAKRVAGARAVRVGGLGTEGHWEWRLLSKALTERLRRSSPMGEPLKKSESPLAHPAGTAGDMPQAWCARCRRPAAEQDLISVGGIWKHRHPACCRLDEAPLDTQGQESPG